MKQKALKKISFRLFSIFVMTIVFISFTMLYTGSSTVKATSIDDLEDRIAELEAENKKLNSEMSSTTGKIKDEESRQAMLTTQITNTEKQIQLYNDKIRVMEENISLKKDEITGKEAEIFSNEELFSQRVRAMYISGSTSMLTTVLSAKSFSEFLTRAEILKRISQSDQELIDTLNKQKTELAQQKADMEEQNKALEATKESLETTSSSLEGLKAESKKAQSNLEAEYAKYYAEKKKNQKEIDAQQAEIDRLAAAANGGVAPGEGTYKWPVPSSARITSPYGWRSWGSTKEFHTGIDIGASSGTDIVAANGGTVIMVKKQSYGYGWHLMIDHGGGHVTLYAHTSKIDVNVGDVVQRGQVIAHVGTTGNSTGNHLHFEVRVNGAKKDPMGYVKKPA